MVKKLLSVIMLCCLLIIGTGTLTTAFAETPTEIEPNQSYMQTVPTASNVEPTSTNSPTPPSCIVSTPQKIEGNDSLFDEPYLRVDNSNYYNCAVVYTWTTTGGNLRLSTGKPNTFYEDMGTTYYREVSFPESTVNVVPDDRYAYYARECEPNYKYGFTASDEGASTSDTSIGWVEEYKVGEITYFRTRYSFDCKYACVGRINTNLMGSVTVPTTYDEDMFVWEHKGGTGKLLKGTIMYGDQITDIEVKIPWLGYSTASATLNGVTFSFRTGPNKCSIKADKSIYACYVYFAFGVEDGKYNLP